MNTDRTDSTAGIDPTGTWRITEMEMWGEDYLHRETQAYIQIGDGLQHWTSLL